MLEMCECGHLKSYHVTSIETPLGCGGMVAVQSVAVLNFKPCLCASFTPAQQTADSGENPTHPRTLSDAVDLARGLNNPPSKPVRFSSWENCPLCDSTHIEVHEDRILKPEVVCTDCGISLQGETVFEIKAKWNKREPICDCGVCNTCLRQKLRNRF